MPQLAQRLQFVDDRHWAILKVVESGSVAEAEICVEELIADLQAYIEESK